MAKLLVRLHGEDVSRLTLEGGVEYIAGRAADANIVLSGERGISRQHLKFYQRDGQWVCETLSKFVLIQKAGQSVEVVELNEPCTFTVPPYEFSFDPDNAPVDSLPKEAPSENLPVFYQPRMQSAPNPDNTSPGVGMTKINNEATMAGQASNLQPYLRISFPNTADDEVRKLEGHLWVAGRDPNCHIPIESSHVSRKHFELARTNEGFFVTDLGSSNGTAINGQTIPPHEPTRLESGDEITIKSVSLVFEIRDTAFSQRMDLMPVPAFDPMIAAQPPAPWFPPEQHAMTTYQEQPHYEDAHVGWKDIRPHHMKDPAVRKRVVRAAIYGLFVLIFVGMFMGGGEKKKDDKDRTPANNTKDGNTSVAFDKLTNDQRSVIKDSFQLARYLYVQGKYELCLSELSKLHAILPQFENSKELESYCTQGKELLQRQKDAERKERERQAIENQIAAFVENCKAKLKDAGTVDETRQCLAEAMELDPEHHLIVEMIHSAKMHEEDRKLLEQQKTAANEKAAGCASQYHKAKRIAKDGKLFEAVGAYERFLRCESPQIGDLKSQAQREIASVKKDLTKKVGSLVDQCKSLGSKGQYKDAYKACDGALKEDPENETAKTERSSMLSELKRELKGVYEDSVLEESLGNVDSAKEKWKKLVRDDIDNGEYAQKAKSKLRRYGIGN